MRATRARAGMTSAARPAALAISVAVCGSDEEVIGRSEPFVKVR